MKRLCSLLLSAALLLCSFSACTKKPDSTEDTAPRTITDLLGREVTLPAEIKRVVCIGAGALRLYCYVGDMSKLCGVEECEKSFLISARPYQSINEELFKSLPSVGAGGPQGSPDAEALITADPDIIFSLYTSDISAMDELEASTGIPVVVLSYGKTEAFDESISASLKLIGDIAGTRDRAKAVTDYISELENDLRQRTQTIDESAKKSVYLGCQSNYGTHGIGSSTADYSLFNAVNAKNVLDEAGYTGYQGTLDLETIVTLNPEVVILDAGGLAIFKEEYAEKKAVFNSIAAFSDKEVYLQLPYNAYYTNLEIAFANAYFIGTVLYPEQFADIDPAEKLDEISQTLLGKGCYAQITETVNGGYGRLDADTLN